MTKRLRTACICVSAFFWFSAVFYLFTGMGLWAPISCGPEVLTHQCSSESFRAVLLMFLHGGGLILGPVAFFSKSS